MLLSICLDRTQNLKTSIAHRTSKPRSSPCSTQISIQRSIIQMTTRRAAHMRFFFLYLIEQIGGSPASLRSYSHSRLYMKQTLMQRRARHVSSTTSIVWERSVVDGRLFQCNARQKCSRITCHTEKHKPPHWYSH
jgi:hypothetical protein